MQQLRGIRWLPVAVVACLIAAVVLALFDSRHAVLPVVLGLSAIALAVLVEKE